MMFPPGSRKRALISGASALMGCTISPPLATTVSSDAATLSTKMQKSRPTVAPGGRPSTHAALTAPTVSFGRKGRSVVLQLGGIGAAGGRNDVVFAQIKRHLAVMVRVVPYDHRGEAEPRVGSGVRAFDRIKHVFRIDGAEGLANRGKRIAQIARQLFFRFRRARAVLVATGRRSLAVKFRGEAKVRARDVLHLLRERAHFGWAELRLFVFEFSLGRAVPVFFFGHGLCRRAQLVFLVLQAAQQCRRNGFLLAHFRGGGLARRLGLLSGLCPCETG